MRRLSLTFTWRGDHHCTRRFWRLLQSRLQPALVKTLPLGGTLDLTWVWHGSRSFRKRARILVCSRRAGGPGATGTAAAGCCCWLSFSVDPGGGTAATDGAGFHQYEAAAVLRGHADARGQQQLIRNASKLWPRGNIIQLPVHFWERGMKPGAGGTHRWWRGVCFVHLLFYWHQTLGSRSQQGRIGDLGNVRDLKGYSWQKERRKDYILAIQQSWRQFNRESIVSHVYRCKEMDFSHKEMKNLYKHTHTSFFFHPRLCWCFTKLIFWKCMISAWL